MTLASFHRQYRHYPTRASIYVDWASGGKPLGGSVARFELPRLKRRAPIADLLEMCRRSWDVIVLCGPPPKGGRAGLRSWAYGLKTGGLPDGWVHGRHYWPESGSPVLRYRSPDGFDVQVVLAESWGLGDVPAAYVSRALAVLAEGLAKTVRGCPLLTTPVATGVASMDRMVDCDRTVWADEDQNLIRTITGQHRMEWVASGRQLPRLVELDMRLAYAALASQLGAGPACHYTPVGIDDAPYAPVFWSVTWTVPKDWDRPYGLLPAPDPDSLVWTWPARPGESRSWWATGAEIRIARAAGWSVQAHYGIGSSDPRADPLGLWARRMTVLCDHPDPLVSRAARAVLVQAIGALVARRTLVYGVAADTTAVPADVVPGTVRQIGAGCVTWATWAPHTRGDLAHPEWAAQIWGRCRARILHGPQVSPGVPTGALGLPPDMVAGFRGDALYLTADPGWPYNGMPGQWRVKADHAGPLTFAGLGPLDTWRNTADGS